MTTPLPDFRLVRPADVDAAIAARQGEAASRFLAGGTDLLVNLRRGLGRPPVLIDLSAIDELSQVNVAADGVHIGACATLPVLTETPAIAGPYRAIAEAAVAIAGPGARGLATVGGNLCLDTRCIYYNQSEWWRRANRYCLKYEGDVCHVAPQGDHCHAAFSGDLAPALMVVGAEVEIAGGDGRRRVPLADLYLDDGRAHLKLAADELLVAVHLPPDPPPSTYVKVRVRGAIDFPLAGVAVSLSVKDGNVAALQIGVTGTNSRPFLVTGTDAFAGRPIDEGALQRLDKLVQKQVQPMRTTTASSQYRRLAAAGLARKLTARLFAEARSAS